MLKNLFLSLFVIFLLISGVSSVNAKCAKLYTDCAKNDIQCKKSQARRIANDKKSYEKWCKQHPGKCSSRKMF